MHQNARREPVCLGMLRAEGPRHLVTVQSYIRDPQNLTLRGCGHWQIWDRTSQLSRRLFEGAEKFKARAPRCEQHYYLHMRQARTLHLSLGHISSVSRSKYADVASEVPLDIGFET